VPLFPAYRRGGVSLLPLTFDRRRRILLSNVKGSRGEDAANFGFAARDAGSADFEDACTRVDAWVGDCAAHLAGVEGRAADRAGVAVSGAA